MPGIPCAGARKPSFPGKKQDGFLTMQAGQLRLCTDPVQGMPFRPCCLGPQGTIRHKTTLRNIASVRPGLRLRFVHILV